MNTGTMGLAKLLFLMGALGSAQPGRPDTPPHVCNVQESVCVQVSQVSTHHQSPRAFSPLKDDVSGAGITVNFKF